MSKDKQSIAKLCDLAVEHIDDAIAKHSNGQPADLSIPLLNTVRLQVQEMRQSLDPLVFEPTYGRFVIDWPDDLGLVRELTDLAYKYGRLKG